MDLKSITRSFLLVTLLFLLGSWGNRAHRIINERSVLSFPPPMSFMMFWGSILEDHAMDADYRKDIDPSEAPKHYINIDEYPELNLSGSITHGWQEVLAAHGLSFVLDKGILPWATVTAFDTLVQCFVRHDYNKAVLMESDLGHYIGDGHNPLHLTMNYDGQATGQNGIHSRYETSMINRYDDLIVYPGDSVWFIQDVNEHVFAYIEANYAYVDSILIADQYAKHQAGSTSSTLYYQLLWEETGTFTTKLLRQASRNLAALIYTAWVQAGSPVFWPNSIGEKESIGNLCAFPNPSAGAVNISFDVAKETDIGVMIMDGAGRILLEVPAVRFLPGIHTMKTSEETLPPGMYYCILTSGKERSGIRFVRY